MMDTLYRNFRDSDFNRRLEISRNFVRILIEHKNFVPQHEKHRIEVAEKCALKLNRIIEQQTKEREYKDQIRRRAKEAQKQDYHSGLMKVRDMFVQTEKLDPQGKGYALEKIFNELMIISRIPVESPFKISGEQIDGAIKYDGHYYLIELKWTADKLGPKDIGSFYYKVDGKMEGRGIIISMNEFTKGVLDSLPRGKDIKVMLLDGMHIANVIYGIYTFQELLEHAISHASIKAELYCPRDILT